MDIKIIEDQIEGLIKKGKGLREQQRLFDKRSGIVELIEKNKLDMVNLETDLATKKEDLSELKAQKADAVRDTLISMQDKITELLPEGDGIVHLKDDGSFIIGWMLPNKPLVPYEGLSGGQKVVFGQALGNALLGNAKEKFLIYEGGEVDEKNLIALLKQVGERKDDTQIIINTWCKPKDIPKEWHLIELK
ncbi:MAG: hypothetical protein JRJ39_05100 [Deltaproteobacteria bacterium]|nr:hypothetical protein [Deltaproteobacteria bacterium]MBW1848337.1 hypothetical protein [Deltaproteobacteria bacterium]MBW1985174.1 hypothetical protein [Deltaproteobacteria bacterium]MBW2178812.1 hypothetical protein [Deltaproteobacteria bacterium]MBW2364329.1 hypothetical protein [Deltaproteobacteria bacterium]